MDHDGHADAVNHEITDLFVHFMRDQVKIHSEILAFNVLWNALIVGL